MTATAALDIAPERANAHLHQAWADAESRCIKCGFCLPVCPTYRLTAVESASPRGRLDLMYAAARGELTIAEIRPALALCLGCLACETACPSGIRYRDMLEAERIDQAAAHPGSPLKRFLLGTLLDRPSWLRVIVAALAVYQGSGLQALVRATRLLWLVPPLARIERRMPPAAWPRAWRAAAVHWGLVSALPKGEAARTGPPAAGMLTGCVMDAAFGPTHLATAKALAVHGWRPVAPAQGCCGALAMHAGEPDLARAMARRLIAAFDSALGTQGERPIVVNSAGCGAAMKDYASWLAGDPAWAARAADFSRRVVDVCEFLERIGLRPPRREVKLRVAYDDPCHLIHAQRIREQPRTLLKRLPGLRWVELPEADWCCGGAGSYTLAQPAMSARVLERKMEHIAALGLDAIATGNPGCLLQIAAGVGQRGLPVRVLHPIELIAMAYEDESPVASSGSGPARPHDPPRGRA